MVRVACKPFGFSYPDYADGVIDSRIVIEDFFLGGNNVVELLVDENQQAFDLTIFL